MVGNFPAAAKCISRACLLLALFLALFSSYAWPQTQLATIFGTITDATGAAISGAQVTILNQSTGLKRDAPTDSTGQYHIAGLPTGTYSVRVEKEGFHSQVAICLKRLSWNLESPQHPAVLRHCSRRARRGKCRLTGCVRVGRTF